MLQSLQLINFRNFGDFKIDFAPSTVIIGKNGLGKTNIIEAIHLISTSVSFRGAQNLDLINFKNNFTRLVANFDDKKIVFTIENQNGKAVKKIKIDEVEQILSNSVGRFKTVFFGPESIDLVFGAPNERRRFLNLVLGQIDKVYLENIIELRKILKQRNKLLALINQNKASANELDFWDKKLVEINKYLVLKRKELIKEFNKKIDKFYNEISGTNNKLKIKYENSLEIDKAEDKIFLNRSREIEAQKTLYGPHRDDLIFNLNNLEAANFSSRGEARSLILALKMAEIDYFEKQTGVRPLLLLDDVFSELDKERAKHLMSIITKQQTIITTTDLHDLEELGIEKHKIVYLSSKE